MSKLFDKAAFEKAMVHAVRGSEAGGGRPYLVCYNPEKTKAYGFVNEIELDQHSELYDMYHCADVLVRIDYGQITILRDKIGIGSEISEMLERLPWEMYQNSKPIDPGVYQAARSRGVVLGDTNPAKRGSLEGREETINAIKPSNSKAKVPAPIIGKKPFLELPWQMRARIEAEKRAEIVALRNSVRSTLGM